jgi:putative membrane protein
MTALRAWQSVPPAQRVLIAGLLLLLAAAQIRQPMPQVAPLHHAPTLALIMAAPFLLRRWPMSTASVGCIVAFFVLHTIGGRYTYTNTPYDDWAAALFGVTISDLFGFERNHYDRLVHFSYGLLIVRPTLELLERHVRVPPRLAIYIAIESVIAVSALYELLEWLLALVMAGPLADDYNGQQGDTWDAHKDMALAAAGALVALFWSLGRGRRSGSAD